jgi:hypothetical protein
MPQFGHAACASGVCDIVRVIVVDICSCVVVTRQGPVDEAVGLGERGG